MNFQGCTTSKESQKAVRQQKLGVSRFPFRGATHLLENAQFFPRVR